MADATVPLRESAFATRQRAQEDRDRLLASVPREVASKINPLIDCNCPYGTMSDVANTIRALGYAWSIGEPSGEQSSLTDQAFLLTNVLAAALRYESEVASRGEH